MEASKVYFTNLRTDTNTNLQKKLTKLVKKAGIANIDFESKYVAIKIHFGEPGNLAFLRPNYARTIVDLVKELGGKPYLTDCNTLYVGGRKNALDHIESAYLNGFTPYTTGCHILIGDGLKGTDDVLVPVEGSEYVKEAKIGRAIMDADVFLTLTHFKGHEATGFGGTLKNIGMGCGSRAGKMEMHSAGKPHVDQNLCIGCGACTRICAHGAAVLTSKNESNDRDKCATCTKVCTRGAAAKRKASINHDKCVGCGRCIGVCPRDAIQAASDEANDILNCKIPKQSSAIVRHFISVWLWMFHQTVTAMQKMTFQSFQMWVCSHLSTR